MILSLYILKHIPPFLPGLNGHHSGVIKILNFVLWSYPFFWSKALNTKATMEIKEKKGFSSCIS